MLLSPEYVIFPEFEKLKKKSSEGRAQASSKAR